MEQATKLDAAKALTTLRGFIGRDQLRCIADGARGEERQYFFDTVVRLAGIVETMPKTYEQEGKGDEAIVHLHYFTAGCDWWITEKDMEPEQLQAFGLADLGDGPDLGYISIVELVEYNAELDFHFKPQTLSQVKAERHCVEGA